MAWCDVLEPHTLRSCRIALGQSQAVFAAMLGASGVIGATTDACAPRLSARTLASLWSAPRELESYFPRISTGRSAGFMFTRASSNSFGGT